MEYADILQIQPPRIRQKIRFHEWRHKYYLQLSDSLKAPHVPDAIDLTLDDESRSTRALFLAQAAAATHLGVASRLMWLDPERYKREEQLKWMDDAGAAFDLAGNAYGLLLQAMARAGTVRRDFIFGSMLAHRIEDVLRGFERREDGKDGAEAGPETGLEYQRTSPNQAYYLSLVALSDPEAAREFHRPIKRLIEHLGNHANRPHGAQAKPLGTYLDIVDRTYKAASSVYRSDETDRLASGIGYIADAYAASLRAARRNDYLWRNMLSPFDYVDFDIAALVICTESVLGQRLPFKEGVEDELALLPIEIARDIDGRGLER